ncbi:ABC transporter substrate-binding protein [Paenibacillus amylolyticus]|uniref:ABC transporter substrate-binding protein n=1 Tax=Paenibacillus amylolyticus TaxID=1451 RepID=UPI00211AAE73|nr:ABC transporter substrate-binding protein [Paenibacillus amylolyticus]
MSKRAFKTFLLSMVALTLIVTACSNASGTNSGDAASNNSGTAGSLKPVELVMAFPIAMDQKDMGLVQEEFSKLIKEKINATVKLVPISFGAWSQQKTLMLSSGEQVDLMVSGLGTYSQDVGKGMYVELDDLLASHGKGIEEAFKTTIGLDILDGARIDGKLYGMPNIKNAAQDSVIGMRKDLIDKYKMDTSKIKNLDDFDQVFKVIKENEPDIIPIAKSGNSILQVLSGNVLELLGDGVALSNDQSSLKVINQFENEEYISMLNTVRRWYLAGYIAKNSTMSTETGNNLMTAGKAFSYPNLVDAWLNIDSTSSGKELVLAHLKPTLIETGAITGFMWSITKNSVDQERAMMLMNLLYTDKDVINLLNYGIEGKHYVKVSDNVIDFPEGINQSNSTYFPNQRWMFGNWFLSYLIKGEDPETYTKAIDYTKKATRSRILGFNFDSEPVRTEIAAVTNVINQYLVPLETGVLDPVTTVPLFNNQLKDAGIDKIIAEKQRQLDIWSASQKQ